MILLHVVGARPQFIKMAALSRIIRNDPTLREVIVHTGQHYHREMSAVFFEQLTIPEPDFNLGINSLTHGAMTGRMLAAIEAVLLQVKPHCVIVYGDTNSTLAGALAAAKLHIPVAHVEAGLRSFNRKMPEELNRILTDKISDFLFCPTETALHNLYREGIDSPGVQIILCGDVMYDAFLYYSARRIPCQEKLPEQFILATIHRAENTDDPANLRNIINALNQVNREIPVIIPMHPRTRKLAKESGINMEFLMIDPVGYLTMLDLLAKCRLVITDSGGLQKEAYFAGKPCVTARNETEWIELVQAGVNLLAGPDTARIEHSVRSLINSEISFQEEMYGHGRSAEKIVTVLKSFSA